MKKNLVIFAALSLTAIFAVETKANTSQIGISLTRKSEALWRIDKTLTSKDGCVFEVHGDYTLLGGFVGTISIKCPGKPKATYEFNFTVPSTGNTVEYVSGDLNAWNAYIENDVDLKQKIAAAMSN